MATYTHRTRTTVRHEWAVPGVTYGGHGAAIGDPFARNGDDNA